MKKILLIGSYNQPSLLKEIQASINNLGLFVTLTVDDLSQPIPSKSQDSLNKYRILLQEADYVLVANYSKENVVGYIGMHTMCEIYDAYLSNKPILLLFKPDKQIEELNLFSPIVLNGSDLNDKLVNLQKIVTKNNDMESSFENLKKFANDCIKYFEGDEVIGWYQRKSKKPRNLYKVSNVFVIIGNSIIATLLLLSSNNLNLNTIFSNDDITANNWGILITIMLSIIVTIVSSISLFFNYKKTWENFKRAQFKIEKEIRKFNLKIIEIETTLPKERRTKELLLELEKFIEVVYETHDFEVETYFSLKKSFTEFKNKLNSD